MSVQPVASENWESNAVLRVDGMTKSFPGVTAVDDVSFDLQPGEVHALVGENGAGKSTLLGILGGVVDPDAGTILLRNEPVRFRSAAEANRAGIAVVYQELSLVPGLSVAENIFFNRQPISAFGFVNARKLAARTAEMLALFQLGIEPQQLVKEFAVGQQQLIEIVKALSLNPKILILDEPTSSLGAAETELLFANIRRLKARGVSFIYVSHHLPEVFEIGDRVTVLRDGKTAGTFRLADIQEDFLVRRMVGRELTNMYGQRGAGGGEVLLSLRKPDRAGGPPLGLEVRRGEIVGLAGLIGAGRTELAQEIAGVEPNPQTEIWLNGRKFAPRHPRDAVRRGVAYLTEDRKQLGLYLTMAVKDNIAAPSLAQFANRFDLMRDQAMVAAALLAKQKFNISTPSVQRKVGQLSGGNQQKVLLSMWIGAEPQLLIADEPTRGVDVGAKAEIYRHLRALAASGIGILLISSELQEILGLSDRVLVMRDRRIVAELPGSAATEEEVILAATGVTERKAA